MNRPGRPPVQPRGDSATITLRVPADIKEKMIAAAAALDMSMTEYLISLVRRDFID